MYNQPTNADNNISPCIKFSIHYKNFPFTCIKIILKWVPETRKMVSLDEQVVLPTFENAEVFCFAPTFFTILSENYHLCNPLKTSAYTGKK